LHLPDRTILPDIRFERHFLKANPRHELNSNGENDGITGKSPFPGDLCSEEGTECSNEASDCSADAWEDGGSLDGTCSRSDQASARRRHRTKGGNWASANRTKEEALGGQALAPAASHDQEKGAEQSASVKVLFLPQFSNGHVLSSFGLKRCPAYSKGAVAA
jgi:hypothetical protein